MPAASKKSSQSFGTYKAPTLKRFSAGILDLIVACIPVFGLMWFGLFYRILGAAIGALYILLKDTIPGKSSGASPGKKSFGMRVEPAAGSRAKVSLHEGILRNLPIAVGPLILTYPSADSYVMTLGILFWIFSLGVECLIILRDPEGRRLGDQIAGTKVFD